MSEQQPVFCAPTHHDARHGAVPASLWDVDASAEVLRAGDSAAALRQSVPIILGGAQRGSHAPNATPLSESIDSFRDGIGGSGGGGGLGGLAAPPSLVTSGLAAAAAASGDLSRFHLQGGLASPLQPEDADRQQQYRPMCPTESSCSSLAHAELEEATPALPAPPPPVQQQQQQAAPQQLRQPPALAAEQTSSKASMKKRRIRGRHVVLCAAALLLLLAVCGGAVAAVLAATGGDASGEPEVGGGGGGGGGGGRRSAWFGCPGCAHDRECVQAKQRADATLKKLEACVQKLEHTKGDEDVCREEATALRSQVDTEKRARSVLQADITRAEEGLETSQADAALLVAATAAAAALLTAMCLRRSARRAEEAAGGQDGAASAAPKPQKFKLGDVVEFPVHDGWRVGRVIKTVRRKEDGGAEDAQQGGATLYAVRVISGPRIFDDDSDASVPEAEEEYVPEADARRVIVRVEKAAPPASVAEPPPPPPPPEKVYVEVINEVEKPCKACPGLQKEVEALRTQVEAGRAAHAEALDALRQSTRREVKEQMRRHEEDDALRTERLVALASRELEESLTKERRRRRDAEGEAHRLADLVREAEVRDLAAETLVEQINSNAAAAAAAFLTAVLKKSDATQANRQR